ncbi:MAG TPA: excalibur calcium-binding domain-containing protein [Deinococcales bacterium]|nr:excalibur calcium-binding domain-containing protein [Deinococcales bacterium]
MAGASDRDLALIETRPGTTNRLARAGRVLRLPALLAALLTSPSIAQQDGRLRIHFLNVGQGDAILLVTPDGKSMAYDAGPDRYLAAQLIKARGVKQLDLAVMSQGDADHIAGFEGVAQQLKPRVLLNNGLAKATRTYARVIAAFQAAGSQGITATERTINLGSQVKLQVLAPPPNVSRNNQNANSVGVLLTFGKFRAFFGGDAEPATTAWWAQKYGSLLKGTPVYKSLHHGSKHNDNAPFLNLVRPKDVFIGVGRNNYGHPSSEALLLYQRVGANIFRTDLSGTLTVTATQDGKYTVTAERGIGTTGQRSVGPLPAQEPPRQPAVATPKPAAPTSSGKPSLRFDPAGPDRDCGDFRTQAEAQAFYVAAGGPSRDPHRLDGSDGNGIACESLP